MIIKMIIREVTILLTLILWLIVEISIIGYSLEFFKRIIKKDFYKGSAAEWLKLTINAILGVGQILFVIAWAWL